jgi:hypothetical protein
MIQIEIKSKTAFDQSSCFPSSTVSQETSRTAFDQWPPPPSTERRRPPPPLPLNVDPLVQWDPPPISLPGWCPPTPQFLCHRSRRPGAVGERSRAAPPRWPWTRQPCVSHVPCQRRGPFSAAGLSQWAVASSQFQPRHCSLFFPLLKLFSESNIH